MQTLFLHASKKCISAIYLIDVLIRRMVLINHNLPSGRLKNDFLYLKKVSKGHVNPFSASRVTKKELWTKTRK
jgi:hypothetical protein